MKTKILSLFVLSVFVFVFLMSAVSAATLANWDFEDNDLIVDSGSGTLLLSNLRTATYPAGNAPSTVAAMSSIGWNVADEYIEMALDTTSYQDLSIKFDERVSPQGPTAFQIQYSSDGTTFTNLGSTTLTVSAFASNPMHTFDFSSITTIDNNTNTKFRIKVLTAGIGSGPSGTFVIDNLLVEGTAISITPIEPQEVIDCQTTGNLGNLEIKNIDFSNEGLQYGGFGEDDEWFPFEEIEVEFEVESDDYDIDDVSVEWGIYSLEDGDWLIDIDEEDELNIKDGKEENFLVTFTLDDLDIDLDEFVDNRGNYRFYVVANGVIDDDNAGVNDGKDTCDSGYDSASIIIERDFVIINNVDMPKTIECGDTVTVTADVWNIGERDQDEVSVMVSGRESVLNFEKSIEVGDIDEFDRQQISFTFIVPQNIDEKSYALNFEVNDEDGDIYENNFDDDTSSFTVPFKVEGSCDSVSEDILVSASLESESKAGKEMIIKATITNNGKGLRTFTVNAAEFASWAEFKSQDQSTVVLDEGQSKSILFTFDIGKDVSGTQTFFIKVISTENEVIRQPVSVNVEKAGSFLGITGLAIGNTSLWGLGLLNLILIIVIVFVAIRIARRK